MENLNEILTKLKPQMVSSLQDWIRTPSVKDEPQENAPFGSDLRKMLDKALGLCERMGFETLDVDGYAGHAEMGTGSDEDALAILVHLDVVPVGDGWTKEPFGGEIIDNAIYGRGVSDDKGPAVAALYAMYAVKQAGIPLKRKVRLIFGCDEESGMECMKYYKTKVTMPRTGFSPDASYPVINIEKGMLGLQLNARPSKEGLQVISWETGDRSNVIPGTSSALVAADEEIIPKVKEISEKYGFEASAQKESDGMRITVKGIAGHAAHPESAKNAIGGLLVLLKELGTEGPLKTLAEAVGLDYSGKGLGVAIEDSLSGKLTCNIGIIRVDAERIYATLDMRCPMLTDRAYALKLIKHHLPNFEIIKTTDRGPHFVPENSELVQKLLEAYHEITGLEKKTLAIGGGTYAKMLEEGVAFGVSFPGDPDVAHQADEHLDLDKLFDSMKIFAHAIVKLAAEDK
ncbi:MAG: dipeptidase PepV [Eubacteriales bacterium]|nr:dipeptidase PepV [Eubacteriales bacterium]